MREDPNKYNQKRGKITTDTKEIQRIVRNYYEQIPLKSIKKTEPRSLPTKN